jgi:DNA-binding response OmpR family regulator
MKVLVVDHETFLAELVKLALEADGHACFTAGSIQQASDLLRSIRFDLLALDLAADEPNTLAWLEETTLGHPEMHGRAFILAGRALEEPELARVLECGAQVIQKPFTLHQLRDTVRLMTPAAPNRPAGRTSRPVLEP